MREDFDEYDFEIIRKTFKDESDRKIFEKVFDKKTIAVIHRLATKNLFNVVEHIISTGKEAHVFVASDGAGNKRAVKIYKTLASDFKNMMQYIEGDFRFKNVKKDKLSLVYAWAKKEHKNLSLAAAAGLSVPLPVGVRDNVLVMEFIGKEKAAPALRETKPLQKELENYYEQTIEFMAGLYNTGLVHADLSEYNILVWNKRLVFIDMGQAVLLSHPRAREFFERDARNMSDYFTKNGFKKTFEELYADVKSRKEKKPEKR